MLVRIRKENLRRLWKSLVNFLKQAGAYSCNLHEIDIGNAVPVASKPCCNDQIKQIIIDYYTKKILDILVLPLHHQ